MKLKMVTAALLTSVTLASAFAQAPAPKMPTQAQCDQGFKDGMGWTKDQFTKACAEMKDKKP